MKNKNWAIKIALLGVLMLFVMAMGMPALAEEVQAPEETHQEGYAFVKPDALETGAPNVTVPRGRKIILTADAEALQLPAEEPDRLVLKIYQFKDGKKEEEVPDIKPIPISDTMSWELHTAKLPLDCEEYVVEIGNENSDALGEFRFAVQKIEILLDGQPVQVETTKIGYEFYSKDDKELDVRFSDEKEPNMNVSKEEIGTKEDVIKQYKEWLDNSKSGNSDTKYFCFQICYEEAETLIFRIKYSTRAIQKIEIDEAIKRQDDGSYIVNENEKVFLNVSYTSTQEEKLILEMNGETRMLEAIRPPEGGLPEDSNANRSALLASEVSGNNTLSNSENGANDEATPDPGKTATSTPAPATENAETAGTNEANGESKADTLNDTDPKAVQEFGWQYDITDCIKEIMAEKDEADVQIRLYFEDAKNENSKETSFKFTRQWDEINLKLEETHTYYAFYQLGEKGAAAFDVTGQQGKQITVRVYAEDDQLIATDDYNSGEQVKIPYDKLRNAKKIELNYKGKENDKKYQKVYYIYQESKNEVLKENEIVILSDDIEPETKDEEVTEDTKKITASVQNVSDMKDITVKYNEQEVPNTTINFHYDTEGKLNINISLEDLQKEEEYLKAGSTISITVNKPDSFGHEAEPIVYTVKPVTLEKIEYVIGKQEGIQQYPDSNDPDRNKIYVNANVRKPLSITANAHAGRHLMLNFGKENTPLEAQETEGKYEWQLDLTGKDDDTYPVTIYYAEKGPDDSTSCQFTLILDTKLPEIAIVDKTVEAGTNEISVKCKEAAVITLSVNGTKKAEKATAVWKDEELGEINIAVLKVDEPFLSTDKIRIEAVDRAGNIGEPLEPRIGAVSPAVKMTGNEIYTSQATEKRLELSGYTNAKIELGITLEENGTPLYKPYQLDERGQASVSLTEAIEDVRSSIDEKGEGTLYLTARYENGGNVVSETLTVDYDLKCALMMDKPIENLSISTESICGTTDANATVYMEIQNQKPEQEVLLYKKADGNGKFEIDLERVLLRKGDAIKIYAVDTAGNQSASQPGEVISGAPQFIMRAPVLCLLIAGFVLFVFSLLWLVLTRRRIKEIGHMGRSVESTLRIDKKKFR